MHDVVPTENRIGLMSDQPLSPYRDPLRCKFDELSDTELFRPPAEFDFIAIQVAAINSVLEPYTVGPA